jgi:uncharacterized protein (DUF2164 family)
MSKRSNLFIKESKLIVDQLERSYHIKLGDIDKYRFTNFIANRVCIAYYEGMSEGQKLQGSLTMEIG